MRNNQKIHTDKLQHTRPTIGLLIDDLTISYQFSVWSGLVDAARKHHVNLLCFVGGILGLPTRTAAGFGAPENVIYDLASARILNGLVSMSATANVTGLEGFRNLCEYYRPLPMITTGLALEGIPSLLVDNSQGMRDVVRHLIAVHGYRRIAFIRGPEGHNEAEQRYQAYTGILAEYGLPFDASLIAPGNFLRPAGREAIQLLLDQRNAAFEAIVAANDEMALGALEELQRRGIRIPEEVAVVGFDNIEEAMAVTPPLTTVRQPMHKLGEQAVELLLKLLNGEEIPEQTVLHTEVVVRQSCGCLDPAVEHAAAGMVTVSGESLAVALHIQRAEILAEIIEKTGTFEGVAEWAEQLLDAFVVELEGTSRNTFLSTLNRILHQVSLTGGDVAAWQEAISVLCRRSLPYLNDRETLLRAEDLWQQARVAIGGAAQRFQAFQALQEAQQAQSLREIGAKLLSSFDIEALLHVLTEGLPQLNIASCYLALYDWPAEIAERNSNMPPEGTRLILAYNEHGRMELAPGGQHFLAWQLTPEGMLPQERPYCMVVEPLYFQEKQIGFVVFEVGPRDKTTYRALQVEISNALQGDLLVQQVQEHTAALSQANEEISTLNEMLKEENLRMGAELDISRRIQQMVLPSEEELKHIEGLEIVGFMKPADEVGGDYYDVLKRNGMIHIGIGDVTGHGLESGVLMLMTQTAIRTLIDHGETDPVAFLSTLNQTLYKNIQRMGIDKSLTLAFVNYQDGQLKLIGQHEEMIVVRRDGQVELVDTIDLGFPIGIEDDIDQFIHESTVVLQAGDGIVLYTDGITEAENMERELYGLERLCTVVSRNWRKSAEEIKQAVFDDVNRHIGRQKVYDDLTLVILKQK